MRLFAILILTFVTLSLALPAFASPQCGPHADVAVMLRDRFGEVPVGSGVGERGGFFEVWANLETGSWTATMTAEGMTCLVAAGGNFKPTKPGEPA